MKIVLDKKHTLYSDSMNIWITRKVVPTKKDGTKGKEVEEQLTGYHPTIDGVLNSLRLRNIRGVDATQVEEINKEIHKSDIMIIKFSKEIDKWVKENK